MIRTLALVLATLGALVPSLTSAAPPFGVSASGWQMDATDRAGEGLFSEFKYFIFENRAERFSGNITFYTRKLPGLTRAYYFTVHLFEGDRVMSYQKGFNPDCVRVSRQDPGLDLCGQGGIEVEGERKLRIRIQLPQARLDLRVTGATDTQDLPLQTMELDSTPLTPTVRALGSRFDMSWKPIFPRAKVSGTIAIGNSRHSLDQADGYSDENWGSWVPGDQPYRWYRFHGVAPSGAPVTAIWFDFPRQATGWTPLFVLNEGRWVTYSRGELSHETSATRPFRHLRYPLSSRELLKILPEDGAGSHFAPTAFTISTLDGKLRIENTVTANDATGLQITRHVPWALKDFVINDQLVDATLFRQAADGSQEAIRGEAQAQWILPTSR